VDLAGGQGKGGGHGGGLIGAPDIHTVVLRLDGELRPHGQAVALPGQGDGGRHRPGYAMQDKLAADLAFQRLTGGDALRAAVAAQGKGDARVFRRPEGLPGMLVPQVDAGLERSEVDMDGSAGAGQVPEIQAGLRAQAVRGATDRDQCDAVSELDLGGPGCMGGGR